MTDTIELYPHEADAMPGMRLIIRPVKPQPIVLERDAHWGTSYGWPNKIDHYGGSFNLIKGMTLGAPYQPGEEYRMHGAGVADQKDDSLRLHIFFRTIERVESKRAKDITWQEALAWNCDPNCGQIALENLPSYLRHPFHPDDYDGNRWCWLFWLEETK